MTLLRTIAGLMMLTSIAALQGCTTIVGASPGEYPPAMPPQPQSEQVALTGSLYQANTSLDLFSDVKARRVGDTITILLNERTQATKSASTDASKDSSLDTGMPILMGNMVTNNGDDVLNNVWESEQDFSGSGSSSQSNRLDGSITVTVAEVYPNGNLLVRGEKWLTLNQGEEYVQVTGIVRPTDIATNNTLPSSKLADARITYSGNGAIADSNQPGLLARIFMKFWPL
ncbi:MAG: flagellar basal body L-ring protein FlgH [Gammaproteobacteria bacterium]|nr:flagellar basal body L-ring protein FlgH [Gammaproteobacteria bacterium]